MLTKELGRTGILLPEIGIGTWHYYAGPELLRKGFETGAWFVDTAESYQTDHVVGEALRGLRDRVFVATKVSPHNFRAADFRKSVDGSLQRLGIETIDLLQLHDPNLGIPIEETMGAMASVIDAGKVRFAGVSNFSVAQLQQARKALGKHPVVSNQVRYNLIDRTIEKDLLPYCQAEGTTVIAYSPLARYLHRVRDADPRGVLDAISRETGKTIAQILLNWCLCKEGVVVIPKGNSEEHVLDMCGASDWRLSAEHLALLDTKVHYRRRGRVDALARRWLRGPLATMARETIRRLPPSLRRRLT